MDKAAVATPTPPKASGIKPPSKIARPSSVSSKTSPSSVSPKPVPPDKPSPDPGAAEFQVGERVYVNGSNGSKAGLVQFIGGTQFAPGQWAGIVLEEKIGKNDGSVAGVRYFQCEDGKGIFTRPSKLSKTKLEQREANGREEKSSGAGQNEATPTGTNTPAPGSGLKSALSRMKSSESVSNISDTESMKKNRRELRLGDRVLVGGTKAGVVRFLGDADFAKGSWCGVELDEPLGKNDGAVAGTRYFQCSPRYGLFAPVHKVTRIGFPSTTPSKAKSSNRRAGAGAGAGAGQRKSPSASSVSSLSSAASSVSGKPSRAGLLTETSARYARKISGTTALQEALKEKQQHIEQLLAERDLERGEVAKATSHAGDITLELALLRKGREQYAVEMEEKLDQLRSLVEAADREKVELSNQLEEEKRKVEDLQFSVEEACITKGDLETQTRLELVHIRELEQTLLFEKTKAEKLQRDLEDTRVATVSERSRIMELEREVCELQLRLSAAQRQQDQHTTSQQHILSLKSQAASQEKKISELSVDVESKDKELCSLQTDRHSLQEQLNNMRQKLEEEEDEKKKTKKTMQDLEQSLEQMKTENQTLTEHSHGTEEQLKQANGTSERTLLTIEQLTNEKRALDTQLEGLTQELSLSQADNHRICKEIEELKSASQKSQRLDEHNEDRTAPQTDMKTRESICTQDTDGDTKSISEKDRELEMLRNELCVLRGERAASRSLQTAVDTLRRDKELLLSRLQGLEQRIMGNAPGGGGGEEEEEGDTHTVAAAASGDAAVEQLREEKEFAEGQINFLNSVIVDLQRKNEELKIKLKKLALTQFNGNDEDGLIDVSSKRDKQKKAPPRLFCDICDCFDLHDTEDCPTQEDPSPPDEALSPGAVPHTVSRGPRGERAYCDSCEAFGHSTENCTDDQTF